jgi:hypothetical protein
MHFIGKIPSKENIKMHTAANARLNIGVASGKFHFEKHHIKKQWPRLRYKRSVF